MSYNVDAHDNGDGADALIGITAVDPKGTKIGKVTDVLRDPESGRARWALIDLGMLKAAHYAPLGEAYRSTSDDLVLDLDRRLIANAPKAARGSELTPELVAELEHYYDHV